MVLFSSTRALYAIGGHSDNELLSSVERYDLHGNIWSEVARLPRPLRCLTALSYKGRLFVMGGETTDGISNAAFR